MAQGKRETWIDRLRRSQPALYERVNAEIDARIEKAAAIYRRWNLLRYCAPRTFRLYVRARRTRIAKYELQQGLRRYAVRKGG